MIYFHKDGEIATLQKHFSEDRTPLFSQKAVSSQLILAKRLRSVMKYLSSLGKV